MIATETIQTTAPAPTRAQPRLPTSHQCVVLLAGLVAGNRYTVASAISSLGIYALSQRCGDLRRLGWQVKDEWRETAAGARIKEYFIPRQGDLLG